VRMGRPPIRVTDSTGRTQQFGYDSAGNINSVSTGSATSPVQTETRAYDALNQLSTDTFAGPTTPAQTSTSSYDLHGNLVLPGEVRNTHSRRPARSSQRIVS
jgi:hypothetical protein